MSKTVKKQKKLKPFEKLLTVMISGEPVSKETIETLLGKEIFMYRISTYMWHIKTFANGVVKTHKDGRKAVAYQIVNVDEVKKYMKQNDVPFNQQKKVESIKELAKEEPTVAAASSDVLEVTEVTQTA
jgi:hypothetical protein